MGELNKPKIVDSMIQKKLSKKKCWLCKERFKRGDFIYLSQNGFKYHPECYIKKFGETYVKEKEDRRLKFDLEYPLKKKLRLLNKDLKIHKKRW
jgi:hypothetical protein